MIYKIHPANKFTKELKRLAKKYPSLKAEIAQLAKQLHKKPETGIYLGNNCYKIRISIASKGGGKRGGGRIITHFKVTKDTVYLLFIFDKGEQATVSKKEILDRLKSEGLI